jgi:hypothetical protein
MYFSENVSDKWKPVMEHKDLPEIKDSYRRDVTLRLLENQEKFLKEAAPTNSMGASASGAIDGSPASGPINTWDPILISLVRRSMPQMIAYDVCGVQPMTGPTGLIFAMKSQYVDETVDGSGNVTKAQREAFDNRGRPSDEADTSHSSDNARGTQGSNHDEMDSANNPFGGQFRTGTGMTRSQAEALGDAANNRFAEMAFTIDKISVTARSRALKAEYSTELAQDLKAVHGLDAETELANILSTEILQEINREVIRTIYNIAEQGAAGADTANDGVFDLDTDSNGRWSVEKFKGLMFQIERDRNEIGHNTRRGKANFMICSADVASAMSMAGMLETGHGLSTDDTISTFAGTMNGMKVFVDPYYVSTAKVLDPTLGADGRPVLTGPGQFYVLGYKGSSAYDAGMFYCPYVPLQMVRAMGEETFQPKIGFKTRYGMVANPFAGDQSGALNSGTNQYYRKAQVLNLM